MPIRSIETLFPSMFQRRLVLLAALALAALLVLAAKMAHLTVMRGSASRAEAEARLLRHQWTPTVRGRILDRTGRILARDRASYDLAMHYSVMSGEWASERARKFVRSLFREQWPEMTIPQRDDLIARAARVYRDHAARAVDELSAASGVPRATLDKSIATVLDRIARIHAYTVGQNRQRELSEAGQRGEIVTPELERAIERRVNQPIQEMKTAHRIATGLSDGAALDLGFLLDEETDLTPFPEETGPRATDRVPLLPGVQVFDAGDREYPYDEQTVTVDRSSFPSPLRNLPPITLALRGVGSHILGWMRDTVYKEDNDQRRATLAADPAAGREATLNTESGTFDRGEYRDGDRVGHAGAERGLEQALRGLRGWRTRQLDTDASSVIDARPGRDVRLTIDAELQARVQAIMDPRAGLAIVQPWHRRADEPANPTMPDGTPITGAAVVLDVDTGQILAMVSMPELSRETIRVSPQTLDDDVVGVPLVNRAIDRGYPPGSIVKPLMLCGAVQHGAYTLDQHIACTGHLFPNTPNQFRCWIYKHFSTTHSAQLGHDLDAPDALMVSCNIFFFTLGKRLGVEGIADVYREFGVGSRFGLGVGEEHAGQIGRRAGGKPPEIFDAIQMGIGQGPVTWTPLHAAQAYATIARYGFIVPPTIDLDAKRTEPVDLHLDSRVVAAAMEGLRRSTNEDLGTGNHLTINGKPEPIFNAPGVDVIGKTGTAAASRIFARPAPIDDDADPNAEHDGENPTPRRTPAPPNLLRDGDHSWFVVLVGPKGDRPKYAISVVMDYAGSGGKVSGPIVNQIIHALIAEKYL